MPEDERDEAYWTALRHDVHETLLDEGRVRIPLTLQRLECASEPEVIDQAYWQQWADRQTDTDTVTFAWDWMRLMQHELSEGRPIKDIATEAAIDLAGLRDRLPGVKFNDIQRTVIQCWRHGHELVLH